jgi:hypothetical protein
MTLMPSLMGIFVYNETKLKLTRMLLSSTLISLLIYRIGQVFYKRICFLTKFFSLFTRNLAIYYVGEPIVLTIEGRGMFFLWILGSP